MAATTLLTVEATFVIKGRGLILMPKLPLPASGKFRPFNARVTVQQPGGISRMLEARFQLEHLNMGSAGSRWDIAVMLPGATKEDVPIGSELQVSEDVLRSLRGEAG